MPDARPFSVELCGSFHTFELLDAGGRPITDARVAADFAECEFGSDWNCIYNGSDGINREDHINRGERL